MPLPTLAATVDSTGISAPTFDAIFASLQESYRSIYGSDVDLDPDSQDGEWLGIMALAISDCNQMAILTYNQFSPATSQGVGLSSVVKINGIQRQVPTFSTVSLDVVGQAGRVITQGLVGDSVNQNTVWALPATVTIPIEGVITVEGVCTEPGAVSAAIGTLTVILTPTPGWQTVTNSAAASPGAPVEPDAQLRRRQSRSTALPALTVIDAIYGDVANVPDVERLAVYQNDTSATSSEGIPPHSLAIVVQGGNPVAIAEAIAAVKSPGVGTYGSITEVVFDDRGVPDTIHFFPLSQVRVKVLVLSTALSGYVETTGQMTRQCVAAFLSALDIGTDSYLSRLWAPAGLNGDTATATTGQTQAQLDALAQTFNLVSIAQSREEMTVSGGPYNAGSTTINVNYVLDLAVGDTVYWTLGITTFWKSVITGIAGSAVTFVPAIPIGGVVSHDTPVYVAGDLALTFLEAALTDVADVSLVVT